MNWFYGLTIRIKFFIPIAIVSLLMIAMGIMAINRFHAIDKKVTELHEVNVMALSYLLEADVDFHKALVEERSMIFLNVGSDDFSASLQKHSDSIKSADEKMKKFYDIMRTEKVDDLYRDFTESFSIWLKLTQKVASERESNTRIGRTTAIEISFKDAQTAFINMGTAIASLKKKIDLKANTAVIQSHETVVASRLAIVITILGGLAISIIMLIITPRLVVEPINKIITFMTSLAGEGGDLTHSIPVKYHDELGDMSKAINAFIESLRILLGKVIELGQQFNGQAQRLHGLANDNSDLATNQTREVSMAARAITELANSVTDVAELAAMASTKAQEARQHSDQGRTVVANTISAIDKLAEEVQDSAGVVLKLNQDSGNIASVVNVIKGIAEQINLLALNAAIEAARAGEQGRGFAVVADSVRELAFRTAESTQEIQSMISVLQKSAVAAAEAMQSSKETAQESVAQADKAGIALDKIDGAIIEMSELNIKISTAAQAQSNTSMKINNNTNNISGFASRSANLTQEVENLAQQLAEVASLLDVQLHKFKI